MRFTQFGSHRIVGAVGATAAGLGAAQSAEAAVVYQPADADVPPTYGVDFNGDAAIEFNIIDFETVTKVGDIAPSTAIVEDPSDNRAANLALGTLIGPGSLFSADGQSPSGGDPLNGAIDGDSNPETPKVPAGHFQPGIDPSGFIGVKFGIGGNTHYGWVGYEGVGDPADPTGHVFGLGYEDTADTAIEAGAGIPAGIMGDYNNDDKVDAADYVVWRKNPEGFGGPQGYNDWRTNFGRMLGDGAGAGQSFSAGSVPEPTSLCLLAAGASGFGLYRRRRSIN